MIYFNKRIQKLNLQTMNKTQAQIIPDNNNIKAWVNLEDGRIMIGSDN